MVLFDRIGDKLIEDQSAQIFSGAFQVLLGSISVTFACRYHIWHVPQVEESSM